MADICRPLTSIHYAGYKGRSLRGRHPSALHHRLARRDQAWSVSDAPIHGVDFFATLLAMAGLPPQPDHHQDSVNLVPLLKGESDIERGPMIWHYPVGVPHIAHSHPGSVVREGDWKFLRFYADGREELYNLKDDIGETKNLVATMPEKAAELRDKLNTMLESHNATIPIAVPAKPSQRTR